MTVHVSCLLFVESARSRVDEQGIMRSFDLYVSRAQTS